MRPLDPTRWDGSSLEHEDQGEQRHDDGAHESFDRIAFTHRALDLICPKNMTVAVCTETRRLHVQSGRVWGKPGDERWAMVCVPPTASRRAIAIAVAHLAGSSPDPYVLDVLLSDDGSPYRV